MGLASAAAPSRRDPVNELYDCAGQLVQAARELEVAAARPGTAPASAATLGCLEASLEALARCIDSVRAHVHEQPPRNRLQRPPIAHRALADLEVLRQDLDQASRAARAARRAVGPVVAEAEPA
jgi:hypothetical protein